MSKGSIVRIHKLIAAVAVVAAAAGFSAPKVSAQSDANVRVGHFSPDGPAVDIYVDGRKTFAGVKFPGMSAYTPLAPGEHTVEIRPANSPATSPAVISVKQNLEASKSYLVAALGPIAALEAKVIEDDLTAPTAGKARIRLIHAAVGGPAVDAVADGSTPLFTNIAFGTAANYQEVDAKKYEFAVRAAGKTENLVGKAVSLKDGGVYTIVATGDAANVQLKGFADLPPTGTGSTTNTLATTGSTVDPTDATETPASTEAPSSSVAAVETTTSVAPETTTIATPTATEAPTTVAAPVETAPNTAVPEPTPSATEAPVPTDTVAAPVAGVDTGFGGMSDGQSAVAVLLMGGAVAAFITLGVRRRAQR